MGGFASKWWMHGPPWGCNNDCHKITGIWYLLDTATVQLVGELGKISYSYVIQTEKGMRSTHRRNEIPTILRNPSPPKMRLLFWIASPNCRISTTTPTTTTTKSNPHCRSCTDCYGDTWNQLPFFTIQIK